MLESMETPEHERREIEEYLRSQSGPDFEVEHVEKLTREYVLGHEYSVWDAHTNEGRWWVITNPTISLAASTTAVSQFAAHCQAAHSAGRQANPQGPVSSPWADREAAHVFFKSQTRR